MRAGREVEWMGRAGGEMGVSALRRKTDIQALGVRRRRVERVRAGELWMVKVCERGRMQSPAVEVG